MDKTLDRLVRQQYLVPRRSVAKLRQLSKLQRVSATEIVRRAIDAYDPQADARGAEEAAALEMLAEVHGELRKAVRRIDADMAALRVRQRALHDGSVREQARREAETWLRRNPQALSAYAELFGGAPPGAAAARSSPAGARSSGNGARARGLRR